MSYLAAVNIWASSLGWVLGGLLLGLVFEKILLRNLRKLAGRTKWESYEIIISALPGTAALLFIVAGFYVALLGLPLAPAYQNIIFKVLLVVVILSVTWFVAKAAVGFVNMYARKAEGIIPATTIFAALTRIVVLVVGLLVVLQTLGVSILPILTAFGVGGLAIALALQDTLSNFFSGLQILLSRQFQVGDFIRLETGEEGYVADITWRYTIIRALPNNLIVVPNAKLANSRITNFNLPDKETTTLVPLNVSYGSDLEKVERVTLEEARAVLEEIEGGVSESAPLVRFNAFTDFSISFNVVLQVCEFTNRFVIIHELLKRLHRRYSEEGIAIPFPARTVYLKNEVSLTAQSRSAPVTEPVYDSGRTELPQEANS
jgi:small-conductance mechanosensitive channel